MSLTDKLKATAKNAEGRLEATAGEVTGDDRMKAEGQAKQVQAHLMDAVGSLKDKVKQATEAVGDVIEDLTDKEH